MALCIVMGASSITTALADAPVFNGGAKVGISGWNVDDNDGGTRVKGSGLQLNVNLALQWNQAYAGVGLGGGKFDFGTHAPRQPTGSSAQQSGTLQRGEFDAVLGYYFWERISLFAALKGTSAKWDDGYTLGTGGLGVGVSAQHTIAPLWSLLWHLGVMSLDAKHEQDKIGTGTATTLEFAGVYHANASTSLNFGLKLQSQKLDFDNGVRQTHNVNTLGFGVNHAF